MKPKELVYKWVELFNQGNIDELMELYHEHAINHQVANEPIKGKMAIKEMFVNEFATADMTCIIENIFADGEWAILEWKDPLGLRGCGFFQVTEGKIKFQRGFQKQLNKKNKKNAHTVIFVAINNIFVGSVDVVDIPEKNLHANVKELHKIGVEKVIIFTNDNETIAQNITATLGIDEFRCSLTPEEKREELERLSKINSVAVVGDGGGSYSTILRRGVDIAMGKDPSVTTACNSDVIILNSNLELLPKLILSSRALTRTTYGNIGIWFLVNFSGVAFVFAGIITPVFAVLYSFILEFTHLFPILRLPRICKIKAR